MSQGPRRAFAVVAPLAVELLDLLRPACERIEVAGSLRRRRPWVSDIELVAVPLIEEVRTIEEGLFEGVERVDRHDRLTERLAELRGDGTLAARDVDVHRADGRVETQQRLGEAYQALVYRDVPLDLFIVRPPAQWGVLFALRTGPGDWNVELVTACQPFRRVEGGQVLHLGRAIATPEERDFFAALGQAWVEPRDRRPELVRIDPALFPADEVLA